MMTIRILRTTADGGTRAERIERVNLLHIDTTLSQIILGDYDGALSIPVGTRNVRWTRGADGTATVTVEGTAPTFGN
jgi:hypothetical protein